MGGLTVDRRETSHFHAIENMSRDEIEARLSDLRRSHPDVFNSNDYKVIDAPKTRDLDVATTAVSDATDVALHED